MPKILSKLEGEDVFSQLDPSLREGLSQQGLQLDDQARANLLSYIRLLHRWNKAYNLTSIKQPEMMLSHHLLDSLSISVYLQGDSFIDVGTGAGLPGIPLAIAYPDKMFRLLDSNGKKVRFLFQAKTALGLNNISEAQHRIEDYQPGVLYDGVISRAYASLKEMVMSSEHLLSIGGCFYAMKGRYPDEELSDLPKGYKVDRAIRLDVPMLNQERHLIILKKT